MWKFCYIATRKSTGCRRSNLFFPFRSILSLMSEFTIRAALPDDASFLGKTVSEALGRELCLGLAGTSDRLLLIERMFSRLASIDDSQYSYRNAIIAADSQGIPVGAIIAYDGLHLRRLRKAFIDEARRTIGWDIDENDMIDEADSGEIYLDSLFVEPDHRGQGIASTLINAMIRHHGDSLKPYGLLVEPGKLNARRLYEKLGFLQVGINQAFRTPMLHLQHPPIISKN